MFQEIFWVSNKYFSYKEKCWAQKNKRGAEKYDTVYKNIILEIFLWTFKFIFQ